MLKNQNLSSDFIELPEVYQIQHIMNQPTVKCPFALFLDVKCSQSQTKANSYIVALENYVGDEWFKKSFNKCPQIVKSPFLTISTNSQLTYICLQCRKVYRPRKLEHGHLWSSIMGKFDIPLFSKLFISISFLSFHFKDVLKNNIKIKLQSY